MLDVGDRPQDFTLTNDRGEPVAWADLRGRPVVVFFYPKANTPGCTKEAIAFTALKTEFDALGVTVVGGSADSVKAQGNFRDKHELGVPLLSDPDKVVLEPWGVWAEKKNYGRTYMGIVRSTFLFDADGVLVEAWRNVRVNGHADKVLARARELVG
jgi:peroxiredoxin Q/BCP